MAAKHTSLRVFLAVLSAMALVIGIALLTATGALGLPRAAAANVTRTAPVAPAWHPAPAGTTARTTAAVSTCPRMPNTVGMKAGPAHNDLVLHELVVVNRVNSNWTVRMTYPRPGACRWRGMHVYISAYVPYVAPSCALACRALAWARTQAGKPYVYGGTGPYGYDCSGLVMMAYEHAGAQLPRTTYGMLGSGMLTWTSSPRPGDLAFYGSGHVELYAGNGETWGAHDSGTVIGLIREWETPAYYRVS